MGPGAGFPTDLPASVTELIRLHLHSVADIEALLLMHKPPHVARTAQELSVALYISEQAAHERLVKLHSNGFVAADNDGSGAAGYVYAPRNASLGVAVDDLAVAYAHRRVRVIEYLYSLPLLSVRSFAGAFKLKRGRKP